MLSLVGIGGAGCKVVESFFERDLLTSIFSFLSKGEDEIRGVAIDTSDALTKLNSIPTRNRVLIGSSRAKGHGAGGDVELGRKIMMEESELALNAIRRANIKKPDMFFVVAGMGGGTGTGGLPILVERMKITYNVPIIGVLILPSKLEGTLYMKNTYLKLDEIIGLLDGAIVLDNNLLADRGENILKVQKTVNAAIFNFLSTVESHEILRLTRNQIGTIGYIRLRSEHTSIKDALDKLLRDHVYMNIEKAEKFNLLIYGDMRNVYGQSFAREWVKRRFGAELDFVLRDEPNSKYLNMGLIITGLKDITKRFTVEEVKKKAPSDLEDLLGDIKPLF
jgi:cell division GTPase FtsZ